MKTFRRTLGTLVMAATVGLGYLLYLSTTGLVSPWLSGTMAVLPLFTLGILLILFYSWREHSFLAAAEQRARTEQENLRREVVRLQKELHLLSAMKETMKELGDALAGDVPLDQVLETVLPIIASHIHPQAVTVFLWEKERSAFLPFSFWQEGKVLSREKIPPHLIDTSYLDEARQHHKPLSYAELGAVHYVYPLGDRDEFLGVMKIQLAQSGGSRERIAQLDESENKIKDLLKHIALTIKKPTLYDRAVTDGLTHLFNRPHFTSRLADHFSLARRHHTPLSLIMLDIDNFKNINDTHGHPTGDAVLMQVSHIVRNSVRLSDSSYRYGGEEIIVLVPESDAANASVLAERIRKRVEKKRFLSEKGVRFPVTVSVGVAEYQAAMKEPSELVEAVDQAMYHSKRTGKNRTTVASTPAASSRQKVLQFDGS